MTGGSVTGPSDATSTSKELAARQTGMSFQQTRMSADRTLMSVITTSLSLISFGFTIYQVFQRLKTQDAGAAPARNFGVTLVALGIAMLVMGIVYHIQFMSGLRRERVAMRDAGLIHAESKFPPSMILVTALVLLLIGITAIVSMISKAGPFG